MNKSKLINKNMLPKTVVIMNIFPVEFFVKEKTISLPIRTINDGIMESRYYYLTLGFNINIVAHKRLQLLNHGEMEFLEELPKTVKTIAKNPMALSCGRLSIL